MPLISSANPAETLVFVGYMAKFPRYIAAFSMTMRPWKAACSFVELRLTKKGHGIAMSPGL